jgi:hypothetical protein
MNGRNSRYGRRRQGNLKTKAAIATAVVVGGGAIGVAVVAANHSSPSTASSTSYATSASVSPAAQLDEALISGSASTTNHLLAKLVSVKNFAEFNTHGEVLAIQRGVVVLTTKKFVIVQSKNGELKLWWISGGTSFDDVAASSSGTAALTASTSAATDAMSGNLAPALETVTTTSTVTQLLTPVTSTKTVTVEDAATGTTVEVVVTKTTAEVVTKTTTTTSKIVESATTAVASLKRGDLTLILGLHTDGALHADKVLFVPVSASGASTTSTGTASAPTHW